MPKAPTDKGAADGGVGGWVGDEWREEGVLVPGSSLGSMALDSPLLILVAAEA